MGRKGQERTLPEYYHRGVVAHLIGFDLPVVLDIEMLAPGEGEISAAKRLLERLMERYGRFFDAVVGDALFWEAPLFELCRKHDKRLLAVLKDNNPALLADAQALLQGEPGVEVVQNGGPGATSGVFLRGANAAQTLVLVDGMRGPSSIWYRIRIDLQHVPEDQRPAQEELLADYSPWAGYSGNQWRRG